MKKLICLMIVAYAFTGAVPGYATKDCCTAPDNGTGTVDFPADCPYDWPNKPMLIVNGLPVNTTIELDGPLMNVTNVVNTPGGMLGGEVCTFQADLDWTVTGTGALAGFNRHIAMPVTGEIHIGPRNPGDPVQAFDADIYRLSGELFGDPDFCELRIWAGSDYGLPGPGQTTLTELPSGDYAVDSFFDITYQIEFEGCPGSQLDGLMGITTHTVPRSTCTYMVDWCRLQWPETIEVDPGTETTVYGRVYIEGLTDGSQYNDPAEGMVIGQVGCGPLASSPAGNPAWTWSDAIPNPGWDGIAAGEPDNDEYMATLTAPDSSGDYDYCYRFSGDGGTTWLYGDIDTGVPGEDGSENGYQTANAGQMTVRDVCCLAPDNGTGTATFPADCPYDNLVVPMLIVEGLPPGTTIELWGPLTDFYNVVNTPGGSLGGDICTFDAYLDWTVTGTGDLAGFNRHLYVPVSGVVHTGPRNPGDPVQTFPAKIDSLAGQLFGDPDFCELIVTAGNKNGMPSPGLTTLTQLPSGDFAVDSFFDITYEIDFEGCPDSQLADYVGTTRDTVARTTCYDAAYVVDWGRLQWPLTIENYPGTDVTVYGRVHIAGITDRTTGNDPVPGVVRGQVGYGPQGSDPSAIPALWTWSEASPNPGWDGGAAGEPDNDEYIADLTLPVQEGDYDFCYRFSGDAGSTWLYGDKDTGLPGEDGSENGYQPLNAGKMTVWEVCCLAPDNGSGTVDFPADCPYDHPDEPMKIIEGLPVGTTIELAGPLTDFTNVFNTPGGDLGGEICYFDATLDWTVTGTGSLAWFNRHLWVPVSGIVHIGPRNPGDPVQSFSAEIVDLSGQLFGDPDFCELIFRCGSTHALPCGGRTTLTQLPSGDFAVDSFFDIVYEIEFEGCPGSQLEDYVGTTQDTMPRTTCDQFYTVDWCRLQWPETILEYPGEEVTVYGRLYIAGLTDQTTANDPATGVVRGQVGYGPSGSNPAAVPGAWTWTDAIPNPAWDGGIAGEPNNDEYMATLTTPSQGGNYDFCYRFSGDAGSTWLYGDKNTGQPGEDGSENGYQPANAGKMVVRTVCCTAPDNGAGTIDFPPDCPYDHLGDPMMITAGLPLGTTLELAGPLTDIINVVNIPGGALGGEICTFDATLDLTVTGTGSLAGFNRHLWVPVTGEFHTGPRNPGDPIQIFPTDVYRLDGELFGDPDFCEFIVRAGSDHGMPSPGQAVLTELPSGDFSVDSFFDITYEIEFEGCPDSQLADYAGTTRDTVWRSTCGTLTEAVEDRPEPEIPTRLSFASSIPNPFAVSTTITYAIPAGSENSRVTLKVYDITGRLVQTLVNSSRPVGLNHVSWDGRDRKGNRVASGIYFCRLSAGREAVTDRIVLLR